MSSQKLQTSDRKAAQQTLTAHFDHLLYPEFNSDDFAKQKLEELEKKFASDIKKIKDLNEKHSTLIESLKKKVGKNFHVDDGGDIGIKHRREHMIGSKEKSDIRKKNKPIINKKRKAIATLQSIETREQLAKLFTDLDII